MKEFIGMISSLSKGYAEYAFNLMSGAVNPDGVLPTFLTKLEKAGMNEIIAAANEKMEAYLADRRSKNSLSINNHAPHLSVRGNFYIQK